MAAVLFRCDAGPAIGLGHVMRCKALACAFVELGWQCWFATSQETSLFVADRAPIIVPPGIEGATAVAAAAAERRAGCVVVDHYGLDERFERVMAEANLAVVAIDDLANRRHHCDLLIDSNPSRADADYVDLISRETRLLLGAWYAMLRPEFGTLRASVVAEPPRDVERLLITLGGADPDNISDRCLDALARLGDRTWNAVLVIGPAHRKRDQLARRAASLGVDVTVDPPDIAALMASADFAVTAGGTTCLEFACLGTPAIVIMAADNQRAVSRAVGKAGAALVLENSERFDPQQLADAIARLAADWPQRLRMRSAGRALVDGQGAARVANAVADLVAARQRTFS